MYITSSANNVSLTSSFTICACLNSLQSDCYSQNFKYYNQQAHKSCCVPDFNGIVLNFSPFNLMLAIELRYTAFIMFRYVPCIEYLSKTYNIKGCWICQRLFQEVSSEMIMQLCFSLFIWWIRLIDFHVYPWDKAYLITVDDIFDVFWFFVVLFFCFVFVFVF